jgi:D-alanine-D-alanine ligase
MKPWINTDRRKDLLTRFHEKQLRIAVLLGGFSAEREISIKSGNAVVQALTKQGHPVVVIDVKDELVRELADHPIDIAFIALHGEFGEDGGIQRLLEKRGIPYTGSGPEASYRAMDKFATKEFFIQNNISTAPYRKILKSSSPTRIQALIDEIGGLPVVVKPRAQGSSVGVSIVRDQSVLSNALKQAFDYGKGILIERYINGRELTVGILGEIPLPLIELRPKRAFYDYTAKYRDPETEYLINPDLPPKTVRDIQSLGLKAYQVLGCAGFSRVDIIYSANDGPFVLEVNSIPGLTDHSLVPKAAKAAGIDFPQLCERIIELSLTVEHPAIKY